MSDDFRVILKDELSRRVLRNSSYTLRSFARDLGMPISKLSEMLNGRQGLSRAYAKAIVEKLKLPALKEKLFLASVDVHLSRTPATRQKSLMVLNSIKFDSSVVPLDAETSQKLTPFHFAVKCFLEIDNSAEQEKNISQRFGFSPQQTEIFLKDLELLQQIKKVGVIWKINAPDTRDVIGKESTAEIRRKVLNYRKACYDLILHEIEFGEPEPARRLLSDIVLTVPSSKLPHLKEMLQQMKSNLMSYCEGHPETDDVYLFSTVFFPFSKKRSEN